MSKLNKVIDKFFHKNPWNKFYTKEELDFKIPNLSLYEFLKETADKYPNCNALNYFGKKTSFEGFIHDISLCAKAFKSMGVREGDVVAICMANTPEAIISFYALNKIGAIANMIHPLSAEEEIRQSLSSTNSVMMVTINVTYSRIKNIIKDTDVYKVVIVSPADSMPAVYKFGYNVKMGRKVDKPKKDGFYVTWDNFINEGKNYTGKTLVKTTKNQDAVIMHSGGTTGVPKNIVLTNGNINAMACQLRAVLPYLSTKDSMLAILPIFHCFGLIICMHVPLIIGVNIVLIPQFDAKKFDKLITKYKPTILAGVPTLYEALMHNKRMDKVDLSNVNLILSGGDFLNAEKNAMINEFFKKHNCQNVVVQGYGLTETSGSIAYTGKTTNELGCLGIPTPGNEIKIIDINTRKEAKPGEIGEICVCGPTVMKGYLNNEAETNSALEKDKNGRIWMHTGDMGYLTSEGLLYYVSRLKRMIIVSGYNVYPSHVEDILMNHPAIETVGVIGIPHKYKIQVPKAFVVLKEGYKPTWALKKEIKEYCEKNLAHYMIPKEFEFKEALPKTMLGKVDYRKLEK